MSQFSNFAPSSAEQTETLLPNIHSRPKEAQDVAKASRFWHPFALQRYILYGFGAIFGFLIIGLETIFIISRKAQGLATATSINWLYLYTYGPTALFTLLAAAWTCVYHEAKIIAPWLRAKTSSETEDWLLLDYVTMFSLTVPFRALRNRDFLVAASAAISQLLTVLVIISSSLIRSTLLDMSQPVRVQSQIVDNPSQLSRAGVRPLLASIGHSRYGLGYPDDIVDMVVLQSISRPSKVLLELHATVHGFTAGVDCRAALMNNFTWGTATNLTEQDVVENSLTVDLSVHDCDISASIPELRVPSFDANSARVFGRLLSGKCAGSSSVDIDDKRLVLIFGNFTSHDDAGPNWTLSNCTQIICQPSYNMSKYKVSQIREDARTISLAANPYTTELEHLRSWDIAQAILDAGLARYSYNIIYNIHQEELYALDLTSIDLDDYSVEMLALHNTSFPTPPSLFNASLLIATFQDYYKTHAAYLVHDTLFQPANLTTTGYTKLRTNRLLVQTLASQSMVALCVIAILLLVWMLTVLPANLLLAGNPGTVIGVAALCANIRQEFPRGLSSVNSQIISDLIRGREGLTLKFKGPEQTVQPLSEALVQERPQGKTTTSESNFLTPKLYHPLILQSIPQIEIYIVLLGLVGTLEILLRHSMDHQGIGEIPKYSYYHYIWTSLPSGVLSLVSTVFSSVDSERRILAPFYALNRGPASLNQSINLSFLGLPTLQALYREIKTANCVNALATAAAFLASFLTIASGSLFYERFSFEISRKLRLVGSFASSLNSSDYDFIFGVSSSDYGVNEFGIISSLVLESNLSYPSFTFEHFALPQLTWDGTTAWSNTTGLETHAVVPALQSGLSCYQHPGSGVMAELIYFDPAKSGGAEDLSRPSWPAGERLRINVTGEYCPESSSFDNSASAVFFLGENVTENGTFGVAWYGENSQRQSCSTYFYVWGSFISGTSPVVSASAMSCNASISAVDVEVILSGSEFTISENHRPRPINGTKRDVIPPIHPSAQFRNSVYQDLASFKVDPLLDPFFSLLVHSRHAIPISTLADPTQQKKVADAIIFQHNIIAAQTLSATARIPVFHGTINGEPASEDPGIFAWTGQGSINNTTFPAITIGNPYSLSGRVVQNVTTTRILETLLIIAIALGLLSWALGQKKGVLPKPPTYVASILALLVDGNLLEFWNHETGQETQASITDITRRFGKMRVFSLGLPNRKPNFGIWVADGSREPGQRFNHIVNSSDRTSYGGTA